MKSIQVEIDKIYAPASTVTAADVAALRPEIERAHALVHSGEGKGSDFWDGSACRARLRRRSSMRFRRRPTGCGEWPTW